MRCPACKLEMSIGKGGPVEVLVEDRDEIDEVEVSLICPGCHREFFAVLSPDNFSEV